MITTQHSATVSYKRNQIEEAIARIVAPNCEKPPSGVSYLSFDVGASSVTLLEVATLAIGYTNAASIRSQIIIGGSQPDNPSRSEAIRRLVQLALAAKGKRRRP